MATKTKNTRFLPNGQKITVQNSQKAAQMAKTAQNTRFCHKWQNKTCEMRVIRTDERNE